MKLYIATLGHRRDSAPPVAVDFNRDTLLKFIKALPTSPESGGIEWTRVTDDCWECGCDVVEITELDTLTP